MKLFSMGLATVALGSVLVATSPAPVSADAGCVSKNEFRNTKKGTTLLRTEARIGTHGRLESQGGGYKSKRYRACYGPSTAVVDISYRHHHDAWRVEWKYYVSNPNQYGHD